MNALAELKKILKENDLSFNDINCANIYVRTYETLVNGSGTMSLVFDSEKETVEVLISFLDKIEYYNGFGGQELFGRILTNKNSWLERGEYDGSELWEYRTIPSKEGILSVKYNW